MLTAIPSRWRNLGMLVAVLSILFGGIVLASPTTSAHPASVGGSCSSWHAVGIGYSMIYVAGGSIYATLDERVDSSNGQYCGYMRVHAQSRNIPSGHNYTLQGNLYYSGCSTCGQSHYWLTGSVQPNSSGVYDLWGGWVATSCGRVTADLNQGNITVGATPSYPGGSSVICR